MVASAAGTSIKVAVNEATATAEAARDAAAADAAEEVFKLNKFSTIPHTHFFLNSLSALISRKYKFVLTNCIRSVCVRWGKAWSVCVLNVCLGALSRLISVRFGVDQVYAACVCVCAKAMMS